MVDNLGIYNSQVDSEYDINKDIEQGTQFKQFGQNMYSANEHTFLQESSAPEWGSIADAYNDNNSTKKRGLLEGMGMTPEHVQFNNMVSQYATAHNAYTSNILRNRPTNESRQAAETALLVQQDNVISAANQIGANLRDVNVSQWKINNALNNTQENIHMKLRDLAAQKNGLNELNNKYDDTTVHGAMETSALNMNSMYYHVFVYLAIAVTLLAFVFNLMVNPTASVLNATFVLGALFAVYIISKYFVN
jgi:hypothetical protein